MVRVTERALEFNEEYVAQLISRGKTNGEHLKIAGRALRDAIENELTDRQREVVLLYYFEKMTMREVGETLGIDSSTVSRTLGRARRRIARCMRFYFDYRSFQLEE